MNIPLVNSNSGHQCIHPDAFSEALDHLHAIVSRARLAYIQILAHVPYEMTRLTPSMVLELHPVTDEADAALARQLVAIMQADPVLKTTLLLEIKSIMSPITNSIADLILNNEQTQSIDMYDLFPYFDKIHSPKWEGMYALTIFFCLLQFSTNRGVANRLDTPHEAVTQLFEQEAVLVQVFELIGRTIKSQQNAHVQ